MNFSELLSPENVSINIGGNTKKIVLEKISIFISDRSDEISSEEIQQGLIARERLGTTGIGNGIAIPHCRINGCKKITAAFFKLVNSIDFESVDNNSVDLVFVLIVPSEQNDEHLKALSLISKLLSNQNRCRALRNAVSNEILYQVLGTVID